MYPPGFMSDPSDAARRLSTERGDTLVSAARAATWNDLSLGDELADGRFCIERLLGRGGMGVVYAATDRLRGSAVALKTLDVYDAAAIHAIKREFRALSDIYYPHLVRLHELFVERERCFFTMDLIEGVDFLTYVRRATADSDREPEDLDPTSRVIDRDPVPWRRTRRSQPQGFELSKLRPALEQLCSSVYALHAAGKLHRDLKPSNVLVTGAGQLVILDFGLAFDRFREHASEQIFGGTPLYMAPELLAGEAPSGASDWYAVGVMLYEALTGRDPFFGVGADLLWEKRDHDPLWPSEFVSDLPGELEVLCMRLLKRRPEQRPAADEIMAVLGVAKPKNPSAAERPRSPGELLGRDSQLASLRAAFEKCRTTRRPLVALLAGASGIGKSWLLERFAGEVRDEAILLLGRCHEREWLPHKAFDQVVDGLARELRTLGAGELEKLRPEYAAAVGALFPVLQALGTPFEPQDRALVRTNPREVRRRAYAGLGQLLGLLTEKKPVIIAIDDLHWGDIDSARLLSELFGGEDAPACLLIGTYRDDEVESSACLGRLLGNERPLADLVETWQLKLDELDAEQSRALAASLLAAGGAPAPELLAAICAEARGNPLVLRELVTHVNDSGAGAPLGLAEVVRARLGRLSANERRLFELVCVAGSPLSQAVVSQAAAIDTPISGEVLRLQTERLVRERTSLRPDVIDVFHDRIRKAALSELNDQALRDRHLALALAHERLGAAEPEALARHYAGAGDRLKAADWAETAADASASVLALNRAAELYRMAYELGEPRRKDALRLKLAVALSDAGRGGEAAPLFLEAAAGAPEREALELRRRAAEQFLVSGHTDRGLEALTDVLEAVGLELPRTPRAALFDLVLTRTRLALRGLKFAPKKADEIDAKRLLRVDACKASWALSFVNTILGAAFQARFLHAALASGEPCRVALGLGMEAIYTSTEGGAREHRVEELRRAAKRLAAELDDPHVEAFDALVEGQTSYMFGRWAKAVAALERAERILLERCKNVTWELNSTRFFWGNSLIYFGRWRELSRRLEVWHKDAVDRGDLYAESALRLTRTRSLTLADDAPERALVQIDEALALWRSSEFGVQQFLADLSRVQVALYERDPPRAVALMERMWPEFSRSLMSRIQLCRIHARHHGAFSTLALAEATQDRALIQKALNFADKLDREAMPWGFAFATYVRAAAARFRGNLETAADGLRDAAKAFEDCQMHFYAAAAGVRLGTLLGGDEGKNLVRAGLDRFRAQGVLRPERIVSMMAPGFPEA
jgi:serine/threonine protein kinase/tetratricopeptide (TPR) repeat protein